MLLPSAASAKVLDVALLGIPYDGGTSYRTGARFGPRAVREQSSLIRPWNPVPKVHPFERLRIADCGDVDTVPISIERTLAAIDARVSAVIAEGAMPVCVGGDHSVTLGILRALARRHGRLGLVHFDAHPDTWDEYFGSKYFHGTPFRRSGLRARHRHARGRRAHVVRGARAGAGARGTGARRGRRGRGFAPVRRPRPDHRAARRQSSLRARERPGAPEMRPGRKGLEPVP